MNFKDVKSAEGSGVLGGSYLMPGMYMVTPIEAVYGESTEKGTPYMEVTLKCESKDLRYNGAAAKAKFYLTDKARDRIQYLHEGLYGKLISPDKSFTSERDVCEYFDKLFKAKSIKKPFVTGGSISKDGTKIYSDLPYSGFIVPEDMFEEGAFEVGSARFNRTITSINKTYTPVVNKAKNTDSDIIPDGVGGNTSAKVADDDLPF